MIRTLFLRGARQHAGLLGALTLGLFLFQWAIVWVASRIEMGPGLRQFLGSLLPPGLVDTIFVQFGLASFGGAVAFGYQHPLALIAGIAMVAVMATLPAQERETGFLDLVLSRPLTRTRYLIGICLLVLLGALLPALALLAGGTVGLVVIQAGETVPWNRFLPSALMVALLLLAVGAYTLLFATSAHRRGTAVTQAVGITLLFFWLDFMGDHWDLLETARLLSPFHYFDPALAARSGVPARDAMVLGGITAVCTVSAFLNFRRQDL